MGNSVALDPIAAVNGARAALSATGAWNGRLVCDGCDPPRKGDHDQIDP